MVCSNWQIPPNLSSNTYLFISDFKNLVTYVCTISFSKNISNENKLGKMYCKLYLIITLYWRQNSAKCFETAHTYLLAWFIYWNLWVHKGILFESWRELSIVCHQCLIFEHGFWNFGFGYKCLGHSVFGFGFRLQKIDEFYENLWP